MSAEIYSEMRRISRQIGCIDAKIALLDELARLAGRGIEPVIPITRAIDLIDAKIKEIEGESS